MFECSRCRRRFHEKDGSDSGLWCCWGCHYLWNAHDAIRRIPPYTLGHKSVEIFSRMLEQLAEEAADFPGPRIPQSSAQHPVAMVRRMEIVREEQETGSAP